MTDIHRGVHGRIRQLIHGINYFHFKGHSVNLYIVHASKEPLVISMMDSVQQIVFFVFCSAKRLRDLQAELEFDEDAQAGKNNRYELHIFSTICIWLSLSYSSLLAVSYLNTRRPRGNENDKKGQVNMTSNSTIISSQLIH